MKESVKYCGSKKHFRFVRRLHSAKEMKQYCPQGNKWFAANCEEEPKQGYEQGCAELKDELDAHCHERRLQGGCSMMNGWFDNHCKQVDDKYPEGSETRCEEKKTKIAQKCSKKRLN